ncbi:MAG: TetR/AcrR family transcriptional regulator [Clostridium sp.]
MNIPNIPKEKEELIYKIALKEFSEKGFEKASTNEIVKSCGISKGSLFNYFGNKMKLYMYIVKKSIDNVGAMMEEELKEELSPDMFERVTETLDIKMKASLVYKHETKVIVESYVEFNEVFMEELQEEYAYYYNLSQRVFTENIDYSKFKDGVDPLKVFETLMFICEGYQNKLAKSFGSDVNRYFENSELMKKELKEYTDILKMSVYK